MRGVFFVNIWRMEPNPFCFAAKCDNQSNDCVGCLPGYLICGFEVMASLCNIWFCGFAGRSLLVHVQLCNALVHFYFACFWTDEVLWGLHSVLAFG